MTNQLFFLSLADIFSVYPTIFKELIVCRKKPKQIYLPSDGEWQEKVYYRLLDVQKRVNEAVGSGVDIEDVTGRKDNPVFDHLHYIERWSPSSSPNGLRFENRKKCVRTIVKIGSKSNVSFWSLENISKAAKLLKKPPLTVEFNNEHEMRRVYSLIYDVFRHKIVLSNALNDISFYENFPQYMMDQNRIWLMLFELLDRRFNPRKSEEIKLQTVCYQDAGVEDIAEILWQFRKRLAASISRMRIKYKALSLSQLLPIHLQNEKVAIAALNPIVTGWINPFFLRDQSATNEYLNEMGFKVIEDGESYEMLTSNQFKWDNICPLFISCIPEDRSEFTKSNFMTKHYFIMQDKTFSYGPAIMSKLLDFFELDGDVLQTHIASPRSTAYLAALFYSVNRVNNFYVYGAGSSLKEYRRYMDCLGITNIRIFAEPFTSFPLESKRFGTVVGIFANPPNSFSAISDPIDLICSRGGDLSMLEVLTESEISDDGKRRVSLILEEQLLTLQLAMSRPQFQFILYQTHSIVDAENQDMVQYAIDLINKTILKKHQLAYREKKRLEAIAEAEAANVPAAAMNVSSPRKRGANPSPEDKSKPQQSADGVEAKNENISMEKKNQEDTEENVTLPEIDEFVHEIIPDICINQDDCLKKQSTGSFLSLIRRKSITQLNAKYLIKMAEARGLFGKADKTKSTKTKVIKTQDVNKEMLLQSDHGNTKENKCVNIDSLISRLMQATNASFIRSNLEKASKKRRPITFNFNGRSCSRNLRTSIFKVAKLYRPTQYWWQYAFRCIRLTKENQSWTTLDLKKNYIPTLRRKKFLRKPYPIHINYIKM